MATNEIKLAKLEHLRMCMEQVNTDITALETKVDELTLQGGEPNKLEGVKVNGVALDIAQKMVDILIESGKANGNISVAGVDVAITGLQALAYKEKISQSDLDNALAAVIEAKASDTEVKALQTAVNTLIGSDAEKSVRDIVGLAVAEMLTEADENYNTLIEIAQWIATHQGDAASMRSDINDNKANITKLETLIGELPKGISSKTVVEYIAEATKDFIKKTDLSASTTGSGNVVSTVAYDSATGTFTATKGITALIPDDIASDEEVGNMLTQVFGS